MFNLHGARGGLPLATMAASTCDAATTPKERARLGSLVQNLNNPPPNNGQNMESRK